MKFMKIPYVILTSRIFMNVHEISWIFMKRSPKFQQVLSTFMNFHEDSWTFSPETSCGPLRSQLLQHFGWRWTKRVFRVGSNEILWAPLANLSLIVHLLYSSTCNWNVCLDSVIKETLILRLKACRQDWYHSVNCIAFQEWNVT